MIQEDGSVFFWWGQFWSDRQSMNSDAALWQKPSLWTRLTLVERQTCSCLDLDLLKDTERYSKNVLLQKCSVFIFLKFRFCSAITEGTRQHNGPRSYAGSAGLGIPSNLLPEQESAATSTSPSVCTCLMCCYHRLPKKQDRWVALYWTSLCTASATSICFDINNSFSTVLTNTPCANFLPWGFGVFKSLIRSVHSNELFTFYKVTI